MARGAIELEEELAALFGRGVDAPLSEAEFNRLALEVFAHQFQRNRPFAHYCRARGRTPDRVTGWDDIPAIPTAAFKEADLTTVPPEQVRTVYLTSGTTGSEEKRGRHLLPGTRLYDASLLPNFRAHLLPDRDRIRMLVCGPTARFFPHSSLGHMHTRVLEDFGSEGSGVFWTNDGPRFPCLAAVLEKAEREGEPVCLLGTAFGFVHFLDWTEAQGRPLRLPPGSRIMDTGGYKGRSREVPKADLYALYESRLGVPDSHVVNEYGMTELGSQFYDRLLRDRQEGVPGSRRKVPPPWVRVTIVDPDTLAPLPAPGASESGSSYRFHISPIHPYTHTPTQMVGLIRIFDLANLHSVAAIQTDDLGVWQGDGFEVLGRAAGAEPRGCSLAAEDLPR